jgi:hypothetical protein
MNDDNHWWFSFITWMFVAWIIGDDIWYGRYAQALWTIGLILLVVTIGYVLLSHDLDD